MTSRNLLVLAFGVCGVYSAYLCSFSVMWLARDLVGIDPDAMVGNSIPRDFVPLAQIVAVLLPLFAALFTVANRARLAVWITGPTGDEADALSGRALRALGFTCLGVYLILHDLREIGQSASALVTWSAPSEWNPGSAAIRTEIIQRGVYLAGASLLLILGVRMLRQENRASAT